MQCNYFRNVLVIILLSCFLSCGNSQNNHARQYVDLTFAAEHSVHAVVHIKTTFLYRTSVWNDFFGGSFWNDFFAQSFPDAVTQREIMGAGSGVIISSDGYIITNNHVVENAKDILVTLNDKREYKATIIGADPLTDLALIKIECKDLPILQFANSDSLRIGEWVLAVGNPFNLTSTVTAGIVSAKARNLNILGTQSAIESFIQTDAAVNEGNSGGALVNANGDLVGINSAIASGNGYFTGYSFAIPSNIASKVANDLQKYGSVQRAYVGIAVREITSEVAEQLHLSKVQGLQIMQVTADGAAERAGLYQNDIILTIDGHPVNSYSELKEIVAQHSPGEQLKITFLREGREKHLTITLLNNVGNTDILYGND